MTTQFDGPLNFLVGGIYLDSKLPENSYYVNGFGIDYVAGVLGAATALGSDLPAGYLGTPFFRNNTDETTLKSYGIFGEVYLEVSDKHQGHRRPALQQRQEICSCPFDAGQLLRAVRHRRRLCLALCRRRSMPIRARRATSCSRNAMSASTKSPAASWSIGRFHDDSLLYASYSRGYKSGGINPPLQPIFAVPESFTPELIDAFEIGSKNTFLDGTLRANITAFYYKYKSLQLSRIVARTSVNDNVDANVYGLEGEFIIQPTRALAVNFKASYLHTEVSQDKFLSNPRDPSGGRSDAVIIKDITNGSNCALVPKVPGNAAGANGYVAAVNGGLGLQAPTGFGSDSGINGATGAFGICSVLAGNAAAAGMDVLFAGVEVNIKGNQLPQAPTFKFSAGVQYTVEIGQRHVDRAACRSCRNRRQLRQHLQRRDQPRRRAIRSSTPRSRSTARTTNGTPAPMSRT